MCRDELTECGAQACSTVAKHLEQGQRLNNLGWRLGYMHNQSQQGGVKR